LPWRTNAEHVLVDLSVEMIFWRSRTLLSDWIWSRSTAARSNFLLGGRLLHLPRERQGEVVVLALEEALDVARRLRVALAGLPARARRVAAVDRVLDAGPRSVPSISIEHVRSGKSWRVSRSVSRMAVAG